MLRHLLCEPVCQCISALLWPGAYLSNRCLAQSLAEYFQGLRGSRRQHPHLIPDLTKLRAHLHKLGRNARPGTMRTRHDTVRLRSRKDALHGRDMAVVIVPMAQAEA